jgi:single-stranded DNA-binding protein
MRPRVILLGRLLADPEVYYTPTGDQLARFDLVTTMDATPTEPRRCLAWNQGRRNLADLVVDNLRAGALVYAEGWLVRRPRPEESQPQSNVLVTDLQLLELPTAWLNHLAAAGYGEME